MIHSQHPLDNKLLLGRYRVMRLLGEGGMGTVHLARVEGAEGFTRPVVVKRMKQDMKTTDEGHRLFIREAKILSKLQHPGIVGISDFGVEHGAHIMVLEYVHGFPLSTWLDYRLKHDEKLPIDICLYVVRKILDALHYAHHFDTEEGREIEIVHRDISPDNVLLSNKGYVHLLDFGIASMRGPLAEGSTKSGAFRGKLCYAAPETVDGKPATPRSDQYSAAVVLLELLTLETPFMTDSIALTFGRMLHQVPDPPSKVRDDVPEGLDDVLLKALAKDPDQRYESAQVFSRELRRFQTEDDEDVSPKLRELLRGEFDVLPDALGVESLRDRESALEKILSIMPTPLMSDRARKLPATVLDGQFEPHARPREAATVTEAAQPGQQKLQGLLLGLLVVGGLIALGLGAAVALLSRGGTGEQVVVVGDEDPVAQPPVAIPPAAPPLTSTTPSVALTQTVEVGVGTQTTPERGETPESRIGASPRSSATPSAEDRQARLSRAVQQQSGQFQSCFAQHLEGENIAPEAVLHFSVAKEGGRAQVQVEPPALASTPLGGCLEAAAVRVQFPELDQPVSFRLPVRARITHSKGPG